MHHQVVAIECRAVTVEGTAAATMRNTAIVEVVLVIAIGAGGYAISTHCEAFRCLIALWACQVVGIQLALAEVGASYDDTAEAKLKYAVLYLGVGEYVLCTVGHTHLIPIFRGGGAYRKEVTPCVEAVEGRLIHIARERYGILSAEDMI